MILPTFEERKKWADEFYAKPLLDGRGADWEQYPELGADEDEPEPEEEEAQ